MTMRRSPGRIDVIVSRVVTSSSLGKRFGLMLRTRPSRTAFLGRGYSNALITATKNFADDKIPVATKCRPELPRDFGTIYIYIYMECWRVDQFGTSQRAVGWLAVSKQSIVDDCHALMSFDTRHARHRRRADTPAAATMNSMIVAGSGTAAFALTPEPLPAVWPKWARQLS